MLKTKCQCIYLELLASFSNFMSAIFCFMSLLHASCMNSLTSCQFIPSQWNRQVHTKNPRLPPQQHLLGLLIFQFQFLPFGWRFKWQTYLWRLSLFGLRKQLKYNRHVWSALLLGTMKMLWAYMLLLTRKILSLDRIVPFISQRYIPRKLVKKEFLVSLSRYTTNTASSQSLLHVSIYLHKAAVWQWVLRITSSNLTGRLSTDIDTNYFISTLHNSLTVDRLNMWIIPARSKFCALHSYNFVFEIYGVM